MNKVDLLNAFYLARKNKASKPYVKHFEQLLDRNLNLLQKELESKTYKPLRYTCFLISHPKKREIFAAKFKDRIVHHLYYEMIHKMFESIFIYDSYSCIKKKGTHFGIKRLKHHILSESCNYTKECYCLKIDIKGYFININRIILYNLVLLHFSKFEIKYPNLNWDLIKYLTKELILFNPLENCNFKGTKELYKDFPKHKSLKNSPKNCGIPIGNLTSLLFSNIYLNELDLFIKRVLKCKHYGRYVDDLYIISSNKQFLKSIIPKIELFLKEYLNLELHKGKTQIKNVIFGIEFLGAYILPFRTYISNQSLHRIKLKHSFQSAISYVGLLTHYKSYNIKKKLFNIIIK